MHHPAARGTRSADTSPAAEDVQLLLWRKMSTTQKAQLVTGLSQSVDAMARAGIRHRHPDASARECFLRLAVLKLGVDLAARAYPEMADLPPDAL